MATEREKMTAGKPYQQFDTELSNRRNEVRNWIGRLHQITDVQIFNQELKKWFADCGQGLFVENGINFDYGFNIHIGDDFYANYNLTLLDTCPITIGNHCYFGPDVGLYTPIHPLDPKKRLADVELGAPITIGDNCWFGGHVTILPGVTLGNNVVVGAGSVVTKSFGNNVVLVGNPARVLKQIPNE